MTYKHNLVDFHCHLDLYPEFERLIYECERDKIVTLAVTTTPRAWPRNRQLTNGFKYVRPALGLHPQLIQESFEQELALWEAYLPQANIIGEVGLDAGPNFFSTLEHQKKVFRRILECCSNAGGKILSVHSVRSASLVMNLIDELPDSKNKYIFHWFSGSSSELKRAISLGSYFSVNSGMLKSAKGRGLVTEIPRDRILTETDGPFTFTDQGSPFTPKELDLVINKLCELLQIAHGELIEKINKNLEFLLQE